MRTGMLQWLVAIVTFAACTSEDSNHKHLDTAGGLLTILIPEAAQLSTPPCMCNGKREAPV